MHWSWLLCRLTLLFLSVLPYASSHAQPTHKILLVSFVGNIRERRDNLVNALRYYPERVDCILFWFAETENTTGFERCRIMRMSGSPGHFFKKIRPEFVVRSRYSHILFHGEDISVNSTYDPFHLIHFMSKYHLEVASPVISGSIYPVMTLPGPPQMSSYLYGRLTNFIEVQITAFTALSWCCFWDMLDTETNSAAWGYDLCLSQICDVRMGILDSMIAYHNVGDVHATNNWSIAQDMMTRWLEKRFNASEDFTASCRNPSNVGWSPTVTTLSS